MAQTIKLKRSATPGDAPTLLQLELGEVAINTYDGKMYIKKSVSGTESIVEISGGDSGTGIIDEFLYTATAGQTAFSGNDDNSDFLSYVIGAIQVFLNGILLDPETDYTATNGALITLVSAAAVNDYIQIFSFKKKISDGNVTVDSFSGNNSTTAFTLSIDPGDENNTRVFVDGVYQSKANYTVSGTTLTFSTAPPSGTAIEVESGNRSVTLPTTENLDFPDNVKLRLGTSQDLEIYHDGSNSYVADRGTGNLRLEGTNIALNNQASNKTYLLATDGGSVQLRHNDATKIETTSTGVDITGNIVVSGTVDGRDVASDGAAAVAALPKAGGAMTGAITTNSTFDGRDVATDGTKLDGIETAATADQTQSEINALGITATGLSGTPAISVANITTTGELRGPASLVIDPAGIGDNTGTVVIKGNLQVDGATTTINSTTLTVDDLNLTLASGAANGTAANGAGITIDGASATLTYQSTGDNWAFNKNLDVTGTVTADGLTSSGVMTMTTPATTTARVTLTETNGVSTILDARGSSGNVGTTTNHQLNLVINNVAKAYLTTAGSFGVANDLLLNNTNSKIDYDGGNAGALRFFSTSANAEKMRITSAGLVGILNQNPDTELHVTGSTTSSLGFRLGAADRWKIRPNSGNAQLAFEYSTSSTLSDSSIQVELDSTGGAIFGGRISTRTSGYSFEVKKSAVSIGDGGTNGVLNLNASSKAFIKRAGNDAIVIDSSENIGIGTDSPAAKLHIENGDMRIEKDTKATIGFRGHTTGSTALAFRDSNAAVDRMTISSSGNVGIGTTPHSGWYSNATALQIATTGALYNTSNWEDLNLANNVYINSSGVDSYIQNDAACKIRLTDAGLMDFRVAGAGTAGNAISWDTAMSINALGRVGVGLTQADPVKFEVYSDTDEDKVMRIRFKDDNNSNATADPFSYEYKNLEIENTYSGAAPNANGTKVAKLQLTTVTAGGYAASASIMGLAESNSHEAGAMVFATGPNSSGNEVERMRIGRTGNVGIGETNPNSPLHVKTTDQSIQIRNTGNANVGLEIYRDSDGAKGASIAWGNGNANLEIKNYRNDGQSTGPYANIDFFTGGTTADSPDYAPTRRMRIQQTGEVGIGTDNPGSKLEVYNDTVAGNTQLHIHNDKTGDAGVIRIEGARTSSNDAAQILLANGGSLTSAIKMYSGGQEGDLRFYTSPANSGDTLYERIRITTSGSFKHLSGAGTLEFAPLGGSSNLIEGGGSIKIKAAGGSVDLLNGTLESLNTTAQGITVNGPNSADLIINAPTDNASLSIKAGTSDTGAEEAVVTFYQNTSAKWQMGNITTNEFRLYNYATSSAAILVDTSGHTHIGPSDTDTRITFGNLGTANTNSSHNIRGMNNSSGTIFRFNAGGSTGSYEYEINGALKHQLTSTTAKFIDKIEVGTFPQSQSNTGEAWIGRAADRQDGCLTVQLGGNDDTGTRFEIVDRAWSKVIAQISGEAPSDSLWVASNGNTQFGYHVYNSSSGISMIGPTGRTFWDMNYNGYGAEILLVNNRTASGAVSLLQYRTNSVVEGTLQANGSGLTISNVSDYRKKENIRDLTGSLSVIKSLQPRVYEYREGFGSEGDHIGFIAHEIQAHIPKAVTGDKDDVYTQTDIDEGATEVVIGDPKYQAVSYTHNEIITRLVQSIQEQQTIIDDLKTRIETLES